jgi:hypothetical protein
LTPPPPHFQGKAYEVLRDGAFLTSAEAAGEATYAYGDGRANPTYCHGLAGSAELLIERYRVTGNTTWLARAGGFAQRMLAYRMASPEGEVWPSDAPPESAPDFLCGAAGVGHVFLRLSTRTTSRWRSCKCRSPAGLEPENAAGAATAARTVGCAPGLRSGFVAPPRLVCGTWKLMVSALACPASLSTLDATRWRWHNTAARHHGPVCA